MWTLQTILEKFEFFPIKCRVQRSMDVFNIAQEHRGEANYKPFRLKVNTETRCKDALFFVLLPTVIGVELLAKSLQIPTEQPLIMMISVVLFQLFKFYTLVSLFQSHSDDAKLLLPTTRVIRSWQHRRARLHIARMIP
jgi:hypothetical protein